MTRRLVCGLALALVVGSSFVLLIAQEENCRVLDPDAGRRFLPDRVPMEMDSISVDNKNFAALQFANKSRFAFAALVTAGLSDTARKRYQFVFISEARIKLDRANLPAGMVGMSWESEASADAPTRTMVARDFSGSEIDRIIFKLDASSQETGITITPKGPANFELRIGKYVIQGSQR